MVNAKSKVLENNLYTLDYIACVMISFILLVDTINGAFIYFYIPFNISQVYKMLLVMYMIFRVLIFSPNHFSWLCLFIISLVITSFFSAVQGSFFFDFKKNIEIVLKLCLFPIAYFYFRGLSNKKPNLVKPLFRKVFLFNYYILLFNLILGVLGVGFTQYKGVEAKSGFLYSANEMAALFVLFTIFILYNAWGKSRYHYFGFGLFSLIISIIISTKVAILGTLIIIFFIPFLTEREKLFKLTIRKIKFSFLFLLFSPLIFLILTYGLEVTGLMNRLIFKYHRHNEDILSFMLSSRNHYLEVGLQKFNEEFNIFQKIFGAGYNTFFEMVANLEFGRVSVEMDFFNILFYFGIVGVLITFSLWAFFLVRSFLRLKHNSNYYIPITFISNTLLIMVSFFSGHVIYSGMIGIFIGALNGVASNKKRVSRQ